MGMPSGTLDKKGRACVPANYRQILTAQNTSGVYIRRHPDKPTLECFGEKLFAQFQEAQPAQEDPFFSESYEDKAFSVYAMTELLAFDENGRVRLPDEFIAHAQLAESVTFVGMGDKFEIWDPAHLAAAREERLASARKLRKVSAPS
ncbi:MAG: division/cell wall cluster transcriptional repressor MraZ [Rhizomicrobium sp.]